VLAWGRITANTSTTITAAVSGAATVPLATDKCLIVQVPRLDFASDLAETTAVRSFTNNLNVVKFTNSDNKDDLFTKVVAKGKSEFATSSLGTSSQISSTLPARNEWDSTINFFKNSTYITFQSSSYVYSFDGHVTLVVLGQNNAYQVGDFIYIGVYTAAMSISFTNNTIQSISKEAQIDGTLTTTLTLTTDKSFLASTRYNSFCTLKKLYLKNPEALDLSYNINICKDYMSPIGTTIYTDAIYGKYILTDPGIGPHFPGVLVTTGKYPEATPQSGSPIALHGIVLKSITSDTITTMADLEVLATAALLQGSQYYQKSTAIISYYQFTINRVRDGVQLTGPVFVREGQRISIVPSTGATAIERQVIAWELDATKMTISLTLGDYIKDIWNNLDKNTAATQKALI